MMARQKLFILVGWDRRFVSVIGFNWCFCFVPDFRDLHRRAYSICVSWFSTNRDVYRDLFVCS